MIKSARVVVVLLLMVAFSKASFGYRDVPALVHLNKLEQADTIGFNLVEGLCSLLYPKILDGSVPLYVSPEKKLRIDAASLKSLESSSGTEFEKCPDLFIHEYWSSNRKSTHFQVMGFSFVNKNMLKEKVAYGFVSIQDIDSLLHHTFIKTTANGSANIPFEQALMSRKYAYHLVQLGQEAFYSNPVQAVKLKREAFGGDKEIRSMVSIPARKQLAYQVLKKKYTTDIDWSNDLVSAIEKVLRDNPELYYNLGGERYDSFPNLKPNIPEVRGLLIEENWVKRGRKTAIESARIKIVLAQGDLFWINLEELETYGIVLHYKSLREILSDKPFAYDLFRINSQEIDPSEGPRFVEALKKAPWNQLNAYVLQ